MAREITLSVDAMGGDSAPAIVMDGISEAHVRYPGVRYLVHGRSEAIQPFLDGNPALKDCCEVRHSDDVITGEQKVSQAIRQGRKSSMWNAIDAVKTGDADGVVSAGNTGALMAMAKLSMRTLPGIDRPAICSLFPNEVGETTMLDLGANAQCDVRNLVEFAVMGASFIRAISGIEMPRVGLLNIGSEDLKGTPLLRDAAAILRDADLAMDFVGFIEGDDITLGTVDVVVTDGFTGNVALKTAEGTAKLYTQFLRSAFKSSWMAKLGYLLIKPVLGKVMTRLDPRRYNGALFVGLNGVAVKSHGGTDALGFANAIGVAVDMVKRDLNSGIGEQLTHLNFDAVESIQAAKTA
ncbi:MAG: phosphate acyltransferase PlsX [Rhodospirillaceae bacterium]|nr:phosphate acyltransferase PlsX [Rhodospirillaceae bacterium]MBT5567143.1 phosphate acyltransferase PlsX [Rhodospirillaceae bacterium]MBT6089356.1 phosphate acyltransferase PlsX [Rhodospirillaceae bacterium]MBT6962000.1 phosphate acyltransferase PlsX [Rhodospirillaceae bacterium]MBT7450275.1 phosphate acyltransferase PlsX [Rhodospirillaceae bacterium]